MGKIKEWVNSLGVKQKLIFYAYLTISPVLILICAFLLIYNYKAVPEERRESGLSSVNTLADGVGVLQENIKDFSTYICINRDINNLLTADHAEELNKDARLWQDKAPMEILEDMMSLDGYIRTVALYPENGLRAYLRCMDGSAYVADMEEIRASEIYQATLESDNGMIWKEVPKGSGESYQTNRYDKVVLYRRIYDPAKGKVLGYLVIGADQSKFCELCESAIKSEEEGILILDKSGGELARAGELDSSVEEYLTSEEFVSQHYRERETYFSYGGYEVVCNQKEPNASIVCKISPADRLKFSDIAYMPFMLLLGMLVGLLPLFLIISNMVTKPLRNLTEAITKFSAGDFEQQVEVTTKDEIGEVARTFNHMVDSIRKLIEENYVITLQEKESELAALQAQINPHFLYNTLDSLYWQAMEIGNEGIAETILALSQLFRLVLSKGQGEITLEQEMELISYYLQIQKARFSKKLNYKIEVEDDVKKIKIPKLIVQPFVENAVVHGFENVSAPCMLTITAGKNGDYIHIEVRDTGIGMNTAQMNAIWEEEPTSYAKQRVSSYAIRNIQERLRLKYKKEFHLDIQSTVGKGTTVILEIPVKGEKNHGS